MMHRLNHTGKRLLNASRRPLVTAPIVGGVLLGARSLSRSSIVSAEPLASAASITIESLSPDDIGVRSVVLYVYASCPFCNKVIQYCNAAKIPYTVVEVNPLFKREIAFASDWGKVPVAVVNGVRVVDSDKIIDHLDALLARGAAADGSSSLLSSSPSSKDSSRVYVRGLKPLGSGSPEEAQWREWVDKWLVRTLSPNIYRTMGESWEAFQYMTQRNFSPLTALPAQVVGSVAMWALSGRLKKKYGITDERAALIDALQKWSDAVGQGRPFMGGAAPNLADLAVYGVLQGIRTTQTERDVMGAVPSLRLWLDRMEAATDTAQGPSDGRRAEGSLEHRIGEAPLRR